jgi:hypothetical protein
MSFSYDLKLVIVAYRVALGGDLGGGIFGPFCEELGGQESCISEGPPTMYGHGVLVLAKPCPIALREGAAPCLHAWLTILGGSVVERGEVRSEGRNGK